MVGNCRRLFKTGGAGHIGCLAATSPNHKSPSAIKLPKTWFNERENVYNLNFSILLSMLVYCKMTHIAAASARITVATSSITISVLSHWRCLVATDHISFDYQLVATITSHGNPVYGDCPNRRVASAAAWPLVALGHVVVVGITIVGLPSSSS